MIVNVVCILGHGRCFGCTFIEKRRNETVNLSARAKKARQINKKQMEIAQAYTYKELRIELTRIICLGVL